MGPSPSQSERERQLERIHRVLTSCVRKACSRDLLPLAEDIAQKAMVTLLARIDASGEPLDFGSAYLWRVANHAVIDELRKRGRSREQSSEQSDDTPSSIGGPEDADERRRILEGVRDCLSEANEDRRAALGLYLQGLELREIAQSLHYDRKRADNLVYRGLTALRACLQGKGLRP